MWFHTAVMEIFRPFYGQKWTLKMFDTSHSTPEIVFWSSLTQLERLALEYRQNHPSASSSIFWHLSLLFIGNAIVRNPTGPTWRFNFLLCMYGYAELAGSFRVADGFLRAILYMAVQKKLIPPPEARDIINRLPKDEASRVSGMNGKMPRVRSGHVADLELALDDHSTVRVTDLAEKLEDVFLFEDIEDGPEEDTGKISYLLRKTMTNVAHRTGSGDAQLGNSQRSDLENTTVNGRPNGYYHSPDLHRPSK